MSGSRAAYRLGCNVGGTFTGFLLYDERRVITRAEPATNHNHG